jgi:hypothetical protein
MTIINGIEIDFIHSPPDETRVAIMNNEPIDTTLHVIAVISNPCQFARRYILAREFMMRMERERNIKLYFVELAYGDQEFHVTDKKNKRHLQLRGSIPLWHKENMINIGVKKLLPPTWKAFAWIDADIEFENTSWALDTLKVLNGYKDIVQPFSHCVDMNKNMTAIGIYPSFGFQYSKKQPYGGIQANMWHPGYAWACTRKAYETMGGLYEVSILGAGDHNMSLSLLGKGDQSVNADATDGYKNSIEVFQDAAKNLRLGYVPGVIRHHFHGLKKNRKYMERWHILVDNAYDPFAHITKNKDGLLVPTAVCPPKILEDIVKYFKERNEDEGYASAASTS